MELEARSITIRIDGRTILDGVSVTCRPGLITALVGPSGSGKTTLLHALGLLLRPDGGHVLVDGHDQTRASTSTRRRFWRDSAAFVLQDYGIIDDETVAFNVTMLSRVRRGSDRERRLVGALARVGLADRRQERASHLSGGERQRLAVARAIYRQARVLLVDEPTASLDAANRREIIGLFQTFAREGATVVVASHDEEVIAASDHRHHLAGHRAAPPAGGLAPTPAPTPATP